MESKKIDFSIFEDAKFKAFKESAKAEEQKWADEIEMLTKRIGDSYEYIELGNGDKIAVRARLSYAEIEEIDALTKLSEQYIKDNKPEEANDLALKLYAKITANPLITEEYLKNHKDSYSLQDMLQLVVGYKDLIEEVVTKSRKFRNK
jgi:hypothetical protein